jgi:uncharacterized membrane protein YkvA (DUF1232 family)
LKRIGGYVVSKIRRQKKHTILPHPGRTVMTQTAITPEIRPEVPSMFWSRYSRAVTATICDVKFLYMVLRHPDTPWHVRMVLFLPGAYICSPIQVLPSFIPFIGQLDDVFVIWVANRLVERLVSEQIRQECREAVRRPKFGLASDKFLTQASADEV